VAVQSQYVQSTSLPVYTALTTRPAALKIAKERKSTVLASNAYHHRVDSLTAFVALLLIAGSNVLNNAQWLDPVGGLVISLMVVQAGWGNTKQALLELADVGVEDEMSDNVRKAATKALEGITTPSEPLNVRAVQGVKAGQNYLMDVEIGAPATWTIEQTRRVEHQVRQHIGATVRGVKKVRLRFVANSADAPDFLTMTMTMTMTMESPQAKQGKGSDCVDIPALHPR
jgi:divalent metal cation (Fe/Co/Zn/Cd) transporter